MTNEVISAAETLSKEGITADVVKLNQIFPLPEDTLLASVRKTGILLTVEDVCRSGSVGSNVLSLAAERGVVLSGARRLDLGSGVVPHGAVAGLQHRVGLDAEGICRAARELVHEKD